MGIVPQAKPCAPLGRKSWTALTGPVLVSFDHFSVPLRHTHRNYMLTQLFKLDMSTCQALRKTDTVIHSTLK